MKILAIIPARGGSKGIPNKNIRILGGKPLISYSILTGLASRYSLNLLVTTDNSEIERIAKLYKSKVIQRPINLADDNVKLDPVIFHAVTKYEEEIGKTFDIIITLQPTSPLLKIASLDAAIDFFISNNFDTLISVKNDPHLSWSFHAGNYIPNYKQRLNRQLLPKNFVETGAFLITKREFISQDNRIGPKIGVFELSSAESIDIDTPQDWWIAEKEFGKKKILIRVEANKDVGLGHIYRCLLLANYLIDHDIKFIISKNSEIGIQKLQDSNFPFQTFANENEVFEIIDEFKCSLLINDILDTKFTYIKKCKEKNIKIINFEDLGSGATLANAVINDLYAKKHDKPNHYWGSSYYSIRNDFLLADKYSFKSKIKNVLILFGGTDPSNLTEKLLKIVNKTIYSSINFTCIVGLGYSNYNKIKEEFKNHTNINIVRDVKDMARFMSNADLAFSSQGRTMYELAFIGVPTILLAQNKRELQHEFGYLNNGFINLGLGSKVKSSTIEQTFNWLSKSPDIRKQLIKHMKINKLDSGIERVLDIINKQ